MPIGRDEVVRVARLARLELSEREVVSFTEQLGRIVEFIDKLKEFDVSGTQPMMHAAESALLRDDVPTGTTLPRSKALAGAPSVADGFFRVPPVIE
jgi:aspartyl-tRNA(Asn)/glutamyl-tRNA(Gln) amidotransferase subunit C